MGDHLVIPKSSISRILKASFKRQLKVYDHTTLKAPFLLRLSRVNNLMGDCLGIPCIVDFRYFTFYELIIWILNDIFSKQLYVYDHTTLKAPVLV